MNPRDMIGTRLVEEHEKVNIWELVLEPGQRSELHEHKHDYVIVQVAGDVVAVEPDPTTKSIYKTYTSEPVIPGRCLFVAKGGVETAVNVGKQKYIEMIIELKE